MALGLSLKPQITLQDLRPFFLFHKHLLSQRQRAPDAKQGPGDREGPCGRQPEHLREEALVLPDAARLRGAPWRMWEEHTLRPSQTIHCFISQGWRVTDLGVGNEGSVSTSPLEYWPSPKTRCTLTFVQSERALGSAVKVGQSLGLTLDFGLCPFLRHEPCIRCALPGARVSETAERSSLKDEPGHVWPGRDPVPHSGGRLCSQTAWVQILAGAPSGCVP